MQSTTSEDVFAFFQLNPVYSSSAVHNEANDDHGRL
jgi:hypothetical protein